MINDAPKFGKYVRLIMTGEIHKLRSYDPNGKTAEIESPDGVCKIVLQYYVGAITANEEAEYLLKNKKQINSLNGEKHL